MTTQSGPPSVNTTLPVHHTARKVRRAVAVGAVCMVLIGLVLLYMLMQATNNRDLYEQNYTTLFTINVAVAALLLLGIVWVAYRLVIRFRQGRFGSRLLVKLAAIFVLVGFTPGILIYVVSYQFVSRSIETWFDVKVEGALDAGLALGRVALDTLSVELANKTRNLAASVAEASEDGLNAQLERTLDALGAADAEIWTNNGILVASAGHATAQLHPDRPTSAQFRSARSENWLSWIDGLEDAGVDATNTARIRVLVPLANNSLRLTPESRYLLVSKTLPRTLVSNALAVTSANREYQERSLARVGLKRMYIGTLTLSLFLAVFGAVLLAVVLGNQIARPLLVLTEGVSQVAAGDLTPKMALSGKDELGGLTRAFATMTAQLADARKSVERSMAQVDSARANLQTILDNLTAGVIVLGPLGDIRSSNPGAARILQKPLANYVGAPLDTVHGLEGFASEVQAQFEEFHAGQSDEGPDHWQKSFELAAEHLTPILASHTPNEKPLTIVARGAQLPGHARLLVFDDISEIVSAQRAQAWGEVARRLAHEIKNPLTPIQLSAERLEKKLNGKLDASDQQVLTKSIKTIVDQVDAMKRLVNEFRDYARLPTAQLGALDLNALLGDVLQLYEDESLPEAAKLVLQLDPDCPPVRADAQQIRQVIHNLLQNAQDASESAVAASGEVASITIRTQWQAEKARVRLSVLDEGGGFADAILKRAFEPYVTTKSKGTGLGLAVVKKIADEHGSRVDVGNRVVNGVVIGAQVSLSLPVVNS